MRATTDPARRLAALLCATALAWTAPAWAGIEACTVVGGASDHDVLARVARSDRARHPWRTCGERPARAAHPRGMANCATIGA